MLNWFHFLVNPVKIDLFMSHCQSQFSTTQSDRATSWRQGENSKLSLVKFGVIRYPEFLLKDVKSDDDVDFSLKV